MQGVNSILYQPISIYQPYLHSWLLSFLVKNTKNETLPFESRTINGIDVTSSDEFFYLQDINEQISEHESHGVKKFPIAMKVFGPISKFSDSWAGLIGTQFYLQVLKQIESLDQVSGIVFNIDSGGGMVSGTSELAEAIKNSDKPTASFTNGYMCSAAYNIGAAANLVVSSPHADLIGSIGTYLNYQDFSAMFEKWGAKIYEVYAPQSTEKNKWFRDMREGDVKELEEDLSEHAASFIRSMQEYRGERLKDDDKVFKGKVYRPNQAKEVGLVDEVNTLEWLMNQF